jgi:hypothetical protein
MKSYNMLPDTYLKRIWYSALTDVTFPPAFHPTVTHKAVWNWLLWYCSDPFGEYKAFPSHTTLAAKAGCSVSSVKRVINDLKLWGVIAARQRRNTSNVYLIL